MKILTFEDFDKIDFYGSECWIYFDKTRLNIHILIESEQDWLERGGDSDIKYYLISCFKFSKFSCEMGYLASDSFNLAANKMTILRNQEITSVIEAESFEFRDLGIFDGSKVHTDSVFKDINLDSIIDDILNNNVDR